MSDQNTFSIEEIKEMIKDKTLELPITLALRTPVKITDNDTLSTLTFNREPEAGDVESMPVENQNMGHFYVPIAKTTGQALPILRKLKMRDMQSAMAVISYFLVDSGVKEI